MYPSKPNANPSPTDKDSDPPKVTAPSDTSNEKHGPPSDFAYQSSNPSAPLLPPGPYNLPPPNMEPPPYSSVVAQDSSDWKNPSGSSSGPSNTSPYPLGPGPANQTPYPSGRSSPYGPPAQAPYPTGPGAGPGVAGSTPYPAGPGLGPGITSQPPYSTGPGYIPGPASQAPYPTASMPMPGPVDSDRKIGFTVPVTSEPKPMNAGLPPGPCLLNGNQPGLIYPMPTAQARRKLIIFLVALFVGCATIFGITLVVAMASF